MESLLRHFGLSRGETGMEGGQRVYHGAGEGNQDEMPKES